MSTARLIDVTRTLRRAGRTPTGIDRVERAYLAHFLNDDVPLYAIARTPFGYVLVGQKGIQNLADTLAGEGAAPDPDLLSRLVRRREIDVQRVETLLRRSSIGRSLPPGLARMLSRRLPQSFDYFNVGHSNLTPRVLRALSQTAGHTHVLIHDVIPLDHPEWQKTGTVEPFRRKLSQVSRYADRVIYNSRATQERAEHFFAQIGRVPPSVVAHLGVTAFAPTPTSLPSRLPPKMPYFMVLGTIEPRKNHAFLLDLWDQMGPSAPPLLICGARGWSNEGVFHRLDRLPPDGPIQELSNLDDGAIAYLIANSAGVLFPSYAEGFGLPLLEATHLGARVLCNILPVFREIAPKDVAFSSVSDSQSWLRTIKTWAETSARRETMVQQPASTWADHFNTVLR